MKKEVQEVSFEKMYSNYEMLNWPDWDLANDVEFDDETRDEVLLLSEINEQLWSIVKLLCKMWFEKEELIHHIETEDERQERFAPEKFYYVKDNEDAIWTEALKKRMKKKFGEWWEKMWDMFVQMKAWWKNTKELIKNIEKMLKFLKDKKNKDVFKQIEKSVKESKKTIDLNSDMDY